MHYCQQYGSKLLLLLRPEGPAKHKHPAEDEARCRLGVPRHRAGNPCIALACPVNKGGAAHDGHRIVADRYVRVLDGVPPDSAGDAPMAGMVTSVMMAI